MWLVYNFPMPNDDVMRKVLSEIDIVRETLYEVRGSDDKAGKMKRALDRLEDAYKLYRRN